jgi:hypothetical protein
MVEFVRVFMNRLAALFRRGRLEGDLDEELRSHLECLARVTNRSPQSSAE